MYIHPFESEFSPTDLPTLTGEPLTNQILDSNASSRDRWVLAQRAQQNAVTESVYGFYFAKRFSEEIDGFDGWTNKVAESSVGHLERSLWKMAVIDIAKVNDQNKLLRAASIQGVLESMKSALEASSDPAAVAELSALNTLRSLINPDSEPILKYVRHLRNKWAGHPSVDRDFDSWADADKHLNIPLLEEGLARLVRAHQEAADLAASSSILSPLFNVPRPKPKIVDTPDGPSKQYPMTVAWENVTVFADLMREVAGRDASGLLDQLTSPPGYGSAEDTDWSPLSKHSEIRASIDAKIHAQE